MTGQTPLTKAEEHALLRAWPWPQEAATTRDGFRDVVGAVEAIVAARTADLAAQVEDLTDALRAAESDADDLAAQVARVEALADECADSGCIHLNDMYGRIRAALAPAAQPTPHEGGAS